MVLLSDTAFPPPAPEFAASFVDKIALLFAFVSLLVVIIRICANVINIIRKRKPFYRTDSFLWVIGCLLIGSLATSLDVFEISRIALRKGVNPNNMGSLIGALGEALIPLIFAISASFLHFLIAVLSQTKRNDG